MAYFPNIRGIYVSLRETKLGTVADVDINIELFLSEMEKYKQTPDRLYVLAIPRKEIVNDNSTHLCVVTDDKRKAWQRKGEFTQRTNITIGHDIDEDEEFKESVLREFDDGEEKPAF